MIDLQFYLPCDDVLYSALFPLSILSIFSDLVCDDVSAGPRETCWKWGRAAVFGFGGLTCGGSFVLILDDLVKRVPEICHGFVFCGH